MSGICAVLRLEGGTVDRAALDAALATMRGASPASEYVWIPDNDSNVGLGGLARIGGADARSLTAESGSLALVADARIDNRTALTATLGLERTGTTDAALILAAYRRWGGDCVDHLVGEFAMILWDGERRRLWCARDAFGHRTLAYRETGGCLAIASSPRAVPRLDRGLIRLDLDKVAQFLVRAEERDRTFYEGVRRLPPGHVLVGEAGGVRLRRHGGIEDIGPIRLPSDDAYLEAFRYLWREAVECRLPARGPAAVMLSAGLDSSSVAATAATLLRDRGDGLVAYHAAPRAGFDGAVAPGWIADESEDVRAIAALHANIDLDVVRPTGRSFLDDVDALSAHACMPAPNADNRHWFEELLSRAHRRGFDSILGGFKGNATISYTGIRGLRHWAYTGQWRDLLVEARALAAVRGRRTRAILREAVAPRLPRRVDTLWRAVRGRPLPPLLDLLPTAIRPEFAAERRVEEWAAELGFDPRLPDRDDGRRYRGRILGRVGDAADMYRGVRAMYGVELRDPTADARVIEFCLGIPDQQYLRGGQERQLVRRAMAGELPAGMLQRTTRGAQGADWYERLSGERGRMLEAVESFEGSAAVQQCLDVPRLRALLESWPGQAPLEAEVDYRFRLTSGILMGCFMRWFEGDAQVVRA